MAIVLVCAALVSGCRGTPGAAAARVALEQAGYADVEISFRSGGGIDLVRIDASAPGEAPGEERLQQGAAAVWRSLPFRFDRLRVAVIAADRTADATFSYERLTALFGPRPPGLDRRQVGDEVVMSGLKLVILLSVGALVCVALVMALTLFALRKVRRRRRGSSAVADEDQDDWDGSGAIPS